MQQATDSRQYAVLFVDDEVEAREALADAFIGHLRVITAGGVDEALAILAQQGEDIGVLLTDQRMPGRGGVDLLTQARERWPAIVRILTTAYTDFDDAIAAVNRGEILRYIHKPWNVRELRMELAHAMELFELRREREQLLVEKLSVWQGLLEAGRARDLLVLTAGLPGLRDAVPAAASFLAQMRGGDQCVDWSRLDYWHLMERETRRSMAVATELRALLETATLEDCAAVALADLAATAAAKLGIGVDGLADFVGLPLLYLPLAASAGLLELLLQEAKAVALDGAPLRLAATLSGGDVLMTIDAAGSRDLPTLLNTVDGDVAAAPCHSHLLAAFLLSYHVGGALTAHYHEARSPLFELRLPIASGDGRVADEGCIERVFAMFEG